jgi:uncharacterized protein YyaL (SSP411 family)
LSNRLTRESSPYLLLHAHNPVDWYPWGEEAFARARAEDKPIFLSVGYSTCYWCHVMERESFSDPDIARVLNEGFVPVKVDREERPDVDEIYMAATQLITRSGGWPNSVFLTPDLKPFFAGTYFPPRDAMGRPGFPRLLVSLREAWALRRAEVLQQADAVAEAMSEHLGPREAAPGAAVPEPSVAGRAQQALASRFDPAWGGFGRAPKFPSPSNLAFLLDRAASDDEAREMLVVTLDRMARGGLQDHLAGGFHRYSTDGEWLVPHFEKMLYDNAALAPLYAEADALAPEARFAETARRTLDFVLGQLAHPEGGLLSAIDAETDGHEGAYYTWTADELRSALGEDHGVLSRVWGADGPPTFERDRYVLHLPKPLAEAAAELGLGPEALAERLERGRKRLLEARGRRKPPLVDDKVLADWNGLAIAGLARTGEVLGARRYVDAAVRAGEFVLGRLRGAEGLQHAWRAGKASVPAFLDDYAFLGAGLLRLFAATGDARWRDEAVRLADEQERRLGDAAGGWFTAAEDPRLLFRAKTGHDGATASGTGVAVLNLLELARLTGEARFQERAERALAFFAEGIEGMPLGHLTLVRAVSARAQAPLASSRSAAAAVARSSDEPSSPSGPAAAAVPVRPAGPRAEPAGALAALEDEAREAVEVEGRLGRGPDEDWKPFRSSSRWARRSTSTPRGRAAERRPRSAPCSAACAGCAIPRACLTTVARCTGGAW